MYIDHSEGPVLPDGAADGRLGVLVRDVFCCFRFKYCFLL